MLNQQIVDWATCSNHPDDYKNIKIAQLCSVEPFPPPPPAPPPPPPEAGKCWYTVKYYLAGMEAQTEPWEGEPGITDFNAVILNQTDLLAAASDEHVQKAAAECLPSKASLRVWKAKQGETLHMLTGGHSCSDAGAISNVSFVAACRSS